MIMGRIKTTMVKRLSHKLIKEYGTEQVCRDSSVKGKKIIEKGIHGKAEKTAEKNRFIFAGKIKIPLAASGGVFLKL